MNLEGDDLRAAYYCVSEVMRDRQRHAGKSIPEWLHRHFHRLDREIRMSQLGQQFGRPTEQLKDEKLITAIEAAAILNMSKRQVNERLAAEFNALADRFAAACAVTDPERDPATMLDETDKVRKSHMDAEQLAHQLTARMGGLQAAATLAGTRVTREEEVIPLVVDPADFHRRRVYEAWREEGNRTSRWGALVKLGARIRACPLEEFVPCRQPKPMEVKQLRSRIGVRQVLVDPESEAAMT